MVVEVRNRMKRQTIAAQAATWLREDGDATAHGMTLADSVPCDPLSVL
jgi:hypothetical protein